MEFQEKFVFAHENAVYDTIPLIIIGKMERKYSTGLYKVLCIISNEFYLILIKAI